MTPTIPSEPQKEEGIGTAPSYFIASLKHTSKGHEHITFWASNHRGYALALPRFGRYCFGEAVSLNDGLDCIAVPAEAIEPLLSPEPHFRNGFGVAARFYDTPGPVIDNTRANWNRLIAASLPRSMPVKPKPEVFRKTRRSFALEAGSTQ
ncbi:hypothetical protein [Variovorax sp. PAMC 28711]|uniref:hypothetical protein n=1 Tax=Variovorax sp. PAMC 28711 TaxID=1795631 RepID=UPI00078D8F3E|nr:hypothetical protein [Variovorax sp. PAMC 28711]AMM23025.1 hypothetical protein AX767_00480 [Variovorax sp. PAMC 28711]